jgi:pre-rRNA-processing protein TSR3
MQIFPPTIILRHRLENLKKCSLRGLESRPDFHFLKYPTDELPDLTNTIILSINAPLLTIEDAPKGLLLIDATWRYAAKMIQFVPSKYRDNHRSLPSNYRTAYPRRQEDCPDPSRGLASIEALYISYHILKRSTMGLLDNYYWKEQFLEINQL